MKVNTSTKGMDYRKDRDHRLAGGYGPYAAKQSPEALLRRAVMANLLWEDQFYMDGIDVSLQIQSLIPNIDPFTVFRIAMEARLKQKLRHVPLFIASEMCKHESHKRLVAELLPQIIRRPDEITEFLAIYWRDGRKPIAAQAKKGLAKAFERFDAYQFAKYNRKTAITLKDVMCLVHPKPPQGKEELYKQLMDDTLPVPDTWEVALSRGDDKKATWERLISTKKLGALAFLRNLRNMEEVGVDPEIIRQGFASINPRWLLPLNFFAAAKVAPRWLREIEDLMFRSLVNVPKLSGYTIFIVDVSGSMDNKLSDKSTMSRLHAAAAMTVLAAEMCDRISIYATAGDDDLRKHQTALVPACRGFALADKIMAAQSTLGWGGIFTRQCLEYIRDQERSTPDRIIVFSDSQDCDWPHSRVPSPFGKRNYIIDVSAETRGIEYQGIWTAEISGWSEHFLTFIAEIEKDTVSERSSV